MPIAVRRVSILSLLVAMLLTAASSQALSTNVTVTTFDVSEQELGFEWDENSAFQIVDIEVSVLQSPIALPSNGLVVATLYEVVIPNFYDPLPKKTVNVSLVGANTGSIEAERPSVLDIIGSDSPYGSPGPAEPVLGSLVDRTSAPLLVTETWEMFPNPDWEVVKILAPTAFELQSIRIETQSVPEPATAALLAAGLLGIGRALRRRR